jgi:hypothetical protein
MKENGNIEVIIKGTKNNEHNHYMYKYNDYVDHYNEYGRLDKIVYIKKDNKGTLYYIEYDFSYDEDGFLYKIKGEKTNTSGEKISMLKGITFSSDSINTSNPEYQFSFDKDGMLIEIQEESDKVSTEKTISISELSYDGEGRLESATCRAEGIDDEYTNADTKGKLYYDQDGNRIASSIQRYSDLSDSKDICVETSSKFDTEDSLVTESTKTTHSDQNEYSIHTVNESKYKDKYKDTFITKTIYETVDKDDKKISTITTIVTLTSEKTIDELNPNTVKIDVKVTKCDERTGKTLNYTLNYAEPDPEIRASSFIAIMDDNGMLSSIKKHVDKGVFETIYKTEFDDGEQGDSYAAKYNNETGEEIYKDRKVTVRIDDVTTQDSALNRLQYSDPLYLTISCVTGSMAKIQELMSSIDEEILLAPSTLIDYPLVQPYGPAVITSTLTQ